MRSEADCRLRFLPMHKKLRCTPYCGIPEPIHTQCPGARNCTLAVCSSVGSLMLTTAGFMKAIPRTLDEQGPPRADVATVATMYM